MNTTEAITPYNDNLVAGVIVAWLLTILLAAAGFQRVKEALVFTLMKLYDFFIRNNAIRI
ncbi:MAG TPA: hypothetical protein VET23_02980 [Chitinophagaceae bacterium]|nr:hypothetical protein [Chitinophagaceae bacterium]